MSNKYLNQNFVLFFKQQLAFTLLAGSEHDKEHNRRLQQQTTPVSKMLHRFMAKY